MRQVLVHLPHRYLVRTPVALCTPAIDLFWARPALGCAEHNHRPARALCETIHTRLGFDALNFPDNRVECGGHQLVHLFRLIPLYEIWRVAVTAEKVIH